jgi:hypothetical protein
MQRLERKRKTVGVFVDRLRVARHQRAELRREFDQRRRQEHLDRVLAGIKDNLSGLNGR